MFHSRNFSNSMFHALQVNCSYEILRAVDAGMYGLSSWCCLTFSFVIFQSAFLYSLIFYLLYFMYRFRSCTPKIRPMNWLILFIFFKQPIITNNPTSPRRLVSAVIIPALKKGQWNSNINVWFRFMYSQKFICAASLFPKQNYNVLSVSFHIHVSVSDLYIPRISLPILCCSQICEPILRIFKSLIDTWM